MLDAELLGATEEEVADVVAERTCVVAEGSRDEDVEGPAVVVSADRAGAEPADVLDLRERLGDSLIGGDRVALQPDVGGSTGGVGERRRGGRGQQQPP